MKRFASVLLLIALLASFIPAFAQEVAMDAVLDPDAVMYLQIDLAGKGYMKGDADGVLGDVTQAAIRKAQEAYGLPVTGYMTDQLTDALLQGAYPLQQDSQNRLVYRMQQKLYDWGFLEDAPTGYFGKNTKEAVEFFQSFALNDFAARMQEISDAAYAAMDRSADVIIDQPLYSEATIPCDGLVTEDWYNFILDEYELPVINVRTEDSGDGVKLVQKRLHGLGYLYSGIDGVFGSGTELALKYFQRKSGLAESGACDNATFFALFGENAPVSDEYVMPYMAYVERSKSRVYIYGWDGSGYNEEVKVFKCSCGAKKTPTITGTFYAVGPISDWYWMNDSAVWVRYAFQIQGNYFFHSVLYKKKGGSPTSTSVKALGTNVSHGCIRLAVEDIKWIYENCTRGMKVVIV